MRNLAGSAIVVANAKVYSCSLANGQALLDLRTSTYYNINRVGSFIWDQLKSPVSIAGLEESMMKAFEVDFERCHKDLQSLLNQLADADLIEIKHEGQS